MDGRLLGFGAAAWIMATQLITQAARKNVTPSQHALSNVIIAID